MGLGDWVLNQVRTFGQVIKRGVNGEHGDGAVVNGAYANWALDHLSPPEYVADIDQDYAAMMLKTIRIIIIPAGNGLTGQLMIMRIQDLEMIYEGFSVCCRVWRSWMISRTQILLHT